MSDTKLTALPGELSSDEADEAVDEKTNDEGEEDHVDGESAPVGPNQA